MRVGHISRTLLKYPEADAWWFIVDQLNTHKSESLVKLVAEKEGIAESKLGEKGKSGILETMKTREEFLAQTDHRLRFIYTPKHCSWLNQVEIWFSITLEEVNQVGQLQVQRRLKGTVRKVY